MKKTSIALCAVVFGALVMTNAFAEENETLTTTSATTGAVAETWDVATGAALTGETAAETGAVVESWAKAEETTGDVVEEKDVNAELHAIINKFFEDNKKTYSTLKSRSDFIASLKDKVAKASEKASKKFEEAFKTLKAALDSYKVAE